MKTIVFCTLGMLFLGGLAVIEDRGPVSMGLSHGISSRPYNDFNCVVPVFVDDIGVVAFDTCSAQRATKRI